MACATVNDANLKDFQNALKINKISIEGLTKEDLMTALSKLIDDKILLPTFTSKDILSNIFTINKVISDWKLEARKRNDALKKLPGQSGKIGNASISFNDKPSKTDPQNSKDSIFIIDYNAQAYKAINPDSKVNVQGIIVPKDGVTIATISGSMMLAADTQGNPNENVFGFVTRKNAEDKHGKWIPKKEVEKMVFDESDMDAFIAMNTEVIDRILKQTNNPNIKSIHIPKYIGIDILNGKEKKKVAYMPKQFADALATLIQKNLHIPVQPILSDFDNDLYGLELQLGKSTGNSSKVSKAVQEAMESVKAKRPVNTTIDTVRLQANVLKRQFPNVAERKARVGLIANMFSRRLDVEVQKRQNELVSKDIENQRREVLSMTDDQGNSMSHIILNDISTLINMIGSLMGPEGSISEENLNMVIEAIIKNPDTVFGTEYELESQLTDVTDDTLRSRARKMIDFCAKVSNTPDLFDGLVNAACEILMIEENIKLSVDKSRVLIDESKSSEMKEEDEGVENRNDTYLVKQRFVDPRTTLTYGIKRILGRLYKVDSIATDEKGNKYPIYSHNDLGMRVKIDSGVSYYNLLKRLSDMNDTEDFFAILDKLEEEYPWFVETAEELKTNEDLRNEFFRCFRQVLTVYSVITPDGRIQFKNMGMDEGALLDIIGKNYEGCNILSSTSLYDIEGLIDMENVRHFRDLLYKNKEKKLSEILDKHPLSFAHSMLSDKSPLWNIENAELVHSILRGERINEDTNEPQTETSISNILLSLGIDTTDIDLKALLPDIDWDEIRELDDLEELDKVWSKEARKKLYNILSVMQLLVDKEHGLRRNSNLLNDYRSKLLILGNALTGISETYTQSSFFFDGKSRYSYTHPDAISKIVGTISKGSENKVKDFLHEKYLKFDFFANSPLINTFNEDEEIRRKFMRTEVLSVQTGKGEGTIGKVKDQQFVTGLVSSYWRGGSVLSKTSTETKYFGWYRNPLFSDTESLNMFRLPRITGEGYEDRIIDNLMTVAESEVERIIANEANKNDENIKVDNYNAGKSNASKFNFLPYLNRNQVIITIDKNGRRRKSNSMSLSEAKKRVESLKKANPENTYIIKNEIISITQETGSIPRDYIREQIEQMLNEGFSDFLEFLDELGVDKKSLLTKIKSGVEENPENQENAEQNADNEIYEREFEFGEDEDDDDSDVEPIDKTDEEELDDFLKEFYYNDYYMQSQIIMMFGGDLAYYKNIRDFVKRNKQSYASGEKIWALNPDGTPMTENAVYLKDKKVISNTYSDIKEMLSAGAFTPFEKEMMIGSLDALSNINSTDGFAYRTPNSFKKIYKAMGGVWTDEIDRSFQNMINGNMNVEDFVALVNQIKPFLFTYEEKMINGRLEKVPVQHKNSEYLLSALFSALNTALNHSPELKALQRYAELHDVDCFQFMSCVKEGGFCPLDLNYAEASYTGDETFDKWLNKQKKALTSGKITQEEYNKMLAEHSFVESSDSDTRELENLIRRRNDYSPEEYKEKLLEYQRKHPKDALVALELQTFNLTEENTMHVLPMEDYIIAQPSSDHLTEAKAIIGSQGRNIIPSDLSPEFETVLPLGGINVHFTREQIREMYDTLFADHVLEESNKLNRNFKDIKKTKAMLESAMEGNAKYSGEIRKAFELNDSGTGFRMPMNNPTMNNKGQELILSQFKNHIQKMYIDGGNAILISNFALSHGMNDELHVHYKYVTNSKGEKEKVVDYIPCYLPAYCKEMYMDYLIEKTDEKGYTMSYLDTEKMKRDGVDESLFNLIGYRIPTEDKYSMLPLRIIGFLPIQAGGSIMLPSDIVAMSGSDFDIDKLFLMRKSFRREIAPSNLGIKFRDWLDSKGKKPDKKFIRLLTDYRKDADTGEEFDIAKDTGFTKEDILYLWDNYEDFAEFWDSGNYKYDSPKYVPLKPKLITTKEGTLDINATSKMDYVKSASTRKLLRNNMLVDLYWGILTSVEGSRMLMTPATYEMAKASSRQEIIRNSPTLLRAFKEQYADAIKKYGSVYEALNHFGDIVGTGNDMASLREALDAFIEEYSLEDNPCDIKFYVQTHRNLMDGNGLIGGFAVNSSRHYKFQLFETEDKQGNKHAGLTLDENHTFKIKIPGYGEFTINEIDPRISPITKIPISKVNSQLQSASPDNGKDPLLGDMGINMMSLSRTCFMTAVGFPIELIGFLNRCYPIFNIGNKLLGKRGSKSREKAERAFKLSDFVMDVEKLDDLHQRYILGENIKENPKDKEYLKKLALWWENIKECSQDLNDCSVFVRSDSPNGALEVLASDALMQLLRVDKIKRKIRNSTMSIKGLDKLIDLDLTMEGKSDDEFREEVLSKPIPRMQAYFSCGIANAVNLVTQYLPELSQPMLNQLLTFQYMTGIDLTSKNALSTLRSFLNEYTRFAISSAEFLFTDDLMQERNFYIHDFPMKYKEFMDAKDSRSKYVHPVVRAMALFRMMTNVSRKGIKFKNVGGKISNDSRDDFSTSLDQLLTMDEDTQEFGIDTFKYAYYDHGLQFGASNYGIFYSLDFLDAFNGFIEALTEGNLRVRNGDTSYLNEYTIQHLLNHPRLIPTGPHSEASIIFSEDGNTLTINMSGLSEYDQSRIREMNPGTGNIEFKKLLKFNHKEKNSEGEEITVTDVYRFVNGNNMSEVKYTKVGYNSTGVPFYDSTTPFDKIKWADLQDRGYVVAMKDIQRQEEKENKKKEGQASGTKGNKQDVVSEPSLSAPSESNMKAPTERVLRAIDESTNTESIPQGGYLDEKIQADQISYAASGFSTLDPSIQELQRQGQAMEALEDAKNLKDFPETEEMCNEITEVKFIKE